MFVRTNCCKVLTAKLSSSYLLKSIDFYQNFVEISFSSVPLFQVILSMSIIDNKGLVVAGIISNLTLISQIKIKNILRRCIFPWVSSLCQSRGKAN